jgi:hypothetical protein
LVERQDRRKYERKEKKRQKERRNKRKRRKERYVYVLHNLMGGLNSDDKILDR